MIYINQKDKIKHIDELRICRMKKKKSNARDKKMDKELSVAGISQYMKLREPCVNRDICMTAVIS